MTDIKVGDVVRITKEFVVQELFHTFGDPEPVIVVRHMYAELELEPSDVELVNPLRSFKSIGKYYINGRGRVFSVAKWEGPEETPNVLNGTHVLVDEKEYEVTAVEMFACMHSPTNPYRLSFGLLVKEVQ